MIRIYLSPSTQEHNIDVCGHTEEVMMNKVCDVTQRELDRTGAFDIYRNRPEMSLNQVVAESNSIKPQAHVAIHSNSLNGKTRGVLGLYYKIGTDSYRLTKVLHDSILPIIGYDNGMRAGNGLAETDRINATSTIIEIGFHDNVQDEAIIESHIEEFGVAIAKGICDYFGLPYKKEVEPVTFDEALQVLKDKCGIDPEHWRQANESVKYIDALFIKIAEKIK